VWYGHYRMVPSSDYLTVDEAAKLLHISRNSAYKAVEAGELPHVRLGKTIRIPRVNLEQWQREKRG
jgi:excisionase family DNA binding protein